MAQLPINRRRFLKVEAAVDALTPRVDFLEAEIARVVKALDLANIDLPPADAGDPVDPTPEPPKDAGSPEVIDVDMTTPEDAGKPVPVTPGPDAAAPGLVTKPARKRAKKS